MTAAIRIIYVDDESDLLEISKLFLEDSGDFTVTTAISADEGIRLLEQEKFDAIISDYQMPVMDGIQFLVEVRKRFGPIPFILFTGRGREEVVIQAINSGADFYLQKGGEPGAQFAELINKIRYAVERRNAENEAREAGERYKALIAVSNTGAWEYYDDSGYLWCSPEYFSMLGRDAGQFDFSGAANLNEVWIDLIHPDDRDRASEHFSHYLNNGSPGMYESLFRMQHADGHWIWILSRGSTLRDKNGILTHKTVGTHIDVSESKRAEKTLKESETRFRALVENASDIIRILDREGRIVFDTGASERMLGYPSGFTIGKNPMEFIHPDDLAMVKRELSEVYSNTNCGIPTEFRLRRADGSYTWVESSGKKLIGVPGIDGVVITTRFIDERKKAGEALKESEQRFRQVFDTLPIGMWIADRDGKLLMGNPAGQDIWEAHPQVGQEEYGVFKAWRLPSHEPVRPDEWALSYAVNEGRVTTQELLEIEAFNGSHKFILNWAAPVKNDAGEITGAFVLNQDITDSVMSERALQESEEQYRNYIDNSPEGVFIVDKTGRYQDVNPAACSMLGYSRKELLELSITDIASADIRSRAFLDFLDLQEIGSLTAEYLLRKKNGDTVPVILNAVRLPDGRYMAYCIDVTERKQAEESLRESEEKYRTLVEKANEAIIIAQDEVFVFANSKMSDLLGVPEGELVGKPFVDFIWPDDRDRVVTNYRKRIAGVTISDAYDFRIIGAGGRLKWVYLSAAAISWKGKPATLNLVTDITERKRMEEALKESEERYKALVETAPDMIWQIDPDGTFRYISPQIRSIMGYEPGMLIGRNVAELIPESGRPYVAGEIARHAMLKKPFFTVEVPALHKDGSDMVINIRSSPIFDRNGDLIGLRGIARDISELKQAEEALREANKKLNLLSSVTRHDINNQLSILQGYLRILEKKQTDPSQAEYFQKAAIAAQRIFLMIQFTREYESIGVKARIWQDCRTLVDTAEKQSTLGQVVVKNDLPAGQEVFADPLVVKVFYNLMDNAVRYGGMITTIRFSVEEAGEIHVIVCEDNGEGVHSPQLKAFGRISQRLVLKY